MDSFKISWVQKIWTPETEEKEACKNRVLLFPGVRVWSLWSCNGKAVNLDDAERMKIPCTVKFTGRKKFIDILQEILKH